jgi:DNA helicase HerA-like ATPase
VSSAKFDARVKALGLGEWSFAGCPVVFWDVFGKQGHPVRTTVSEMGPLLLSRILNLIPHPAVPEPPAPAESPRYSPPKYFHTASDTIRRRVC